MTLYIDHRPIGAAHPPFLVAEISANHGGSLSQAIATIDAAHQAGADAVKLQTYHPDTMTMNSDFEEFRIQGGTWDGYTLYELYRQAHTPYSWHEALFEHARQRGITLFSTPFDETAVELLESLDAPAYKIASFEIVDLPLIARVAGTGKPLIISTGMAALDEIQTAIDTARDHGCRDLIILHCISGYPTPLEQANLKMITTLSNRFALPIGLSDHTLGSTASVVAMSLGACLIEKHFTLSRQLGGPDASFSLEPDEWSKLCGEIRQAWLALGNGDVQRQPVEQANRQFRRSLYFAVDLAAGSIIQPQHIRRIRPGYGLDPCFQDQLTGCLLVADVTAGTAVAWHHFEPKIEKP